ncbi:MAG: GNAT family N-acetyltransferase [Candidatus Omnitrophica bacterium CG23_combo_of_CG06-09_8_20_14_all_40_11]|nr:MAG: GNAT family N-acetyltransferase [Candidatus Omnitrophica bacterium CG23_combo_of_CG06-09_8_20_14_all_40_11]
MIRKARIKDIKQIQDLINSFAKQNLMLPRSLNELYDNLRDFWVFEKNNKVIGCSALHVCWQDLTEVKSLAVLKKYQRKNIGTQLITACIEEAKKLGAKKIFALTYKPEFFKKFGFHKVKHSDLPHKIWAECINCPKFPNCQEVALLKKL